MTTDLYGMLAHTLRRLGVALTLGGAACCHPAFAAPQYALTAYGEAPKYPAGFSHFDYVNPTAPKGGTLAIASEDPLRFDHLMPHTIDGNGVTQIDTLVYAPLAVRSLDEPLTVYGLVAQSMDLSADRSTLCFTLNPEARFADGTPITADDVAFTFDLLRSKGDYSFRRKFADVAKVTVESPTQIRFTFSSTQSRTLPLELAQMRVMPKHWWATRNYDNGGGFDAPLGSGPYKVVQVDPGRTVVFERVPDWWGANLPAAKGMYNFDRITLKVYGSRDVMRQALLAHDIDVNIEKAASAYQVGYDGAALRDGRLQRGIFGDRDYASGFVFNLRNPLFRDVRVRRAIAMLWDFEWVNARLYRNFNQRQVSMFAPAALQAHGLPSAAERTVLEPLRGEIAPEVLTTPFSVPTGDGSGDIRTRQIEALHLLESAGWHPVGDSLVNAQGQPLNFTFLNVNKGFERVFMSFKRSLAEIGVTLNLKTVDVAQYGNFLQQKRFDMIFNSFYSPATPGAELNDYYASASYSAPGTQSWMGLRDPAVDQLIQGVQRASTRSEMETYAHALDRVMEWQYLWIPSMRSPGAALVYWNRFGRPAIQAPADTNIDSWWVDSATPVTAAAQPHVATGAN
ncbi:extracellular solute-binding protein [Paraburkholderia sp.]|uniref:extracellular solute-binding protein n=1 Tax=Paraburkholderia sp. TaxID=1926495 RepID=UPI002399DA7E|nr:extracellular solute-binding protein [Paraburkholderia sp.]MDE1181870.1 extracellular solute-binding protein [Paraburkholderia sp.]